MVSYNDILLPLDITVELKENVSCHGQEDGSITILITGLSSLIKYSYKLKDGEGTVLKEGSEGLLDDLLSDLPNLNTGLTIRFEDLAAGNYTFEWTSRPLPLLQPSTRSIEFTIEEPDELEVIGLNINHIDCLNPTGSIEVLTTGGVGSIDLGILELNEINILGGDGNTITDLTEGVYSIVVMDENGCETTATAEIESSVELPEIDIKGDLNLGCHDLLDLQISSSNGVTLTVETPDGQIVGGLIGKTFQVSTPGIYIATAIDPLTGCTSSDTVEVVAESDIPELDLGTDRVLGCLDTLELEAVTNATSIVWQNVDGTILGNGKIIEVSSPGKYVAVALNNLGCENRDTVNIGQGDDSDNAILAFDAGIQANLGCLEVLDLIVINNDGVSMNWETIGGSFLEGPVDTILQVTKPGTYIVSGVDLVTGCLVSDTIRVIAEVEVGTVDIPEDTVSLDCEGNALITADTSDMGGNVELLWETIEGDLEIDDDSTTVIVNSPGVYALIATDVVTGCTSSDTVMVDGSEPIVLEADLRPVSCGETANGQILLSIEGGVAPYTITWSTGDTTRHLTGLSPGEYSVIVTDSKDCQRTGSWVIEKNEAPDITISMTSTGGNESEVTVHATGGTPPYHYLWSTGDTTQSVILEPGNYAVFVTDERGCVSSLSFKVDGDGPNMGSDSCSLNMQLDIMPSGTMGFSEVTIQTEGGTPPYHYLWSTGDTGNTIILEPGQYAVAVTDDAGCVSTLSFTIRPDNPDDEPDPDFCSLELELKVESSNIPGMWNVVVMASGGTDPYSYSWSTGDSTAMVSLSSETKYTVNVVDAQFCTASLSFTLFGNVDSTTWICPDDIIVDSCNAPVFYHYPVVQSNQSYSIIQTSGLCSGSVFPIGVTEVSFLILFEDGSTQYCSFNVIVNPETLDKDIVLPTCNGEADGEISLISADIGTYHLIWNDESQQMGPVASGLKGGTYQVKGANEAGCIINETIVLSEPDSLVLADATVLSSSTEDNGQIQITGYGGTYPYTYQWMGPDGFTSGQEDLYQIGPGTYTLSIIDANGCTMEDQTFVVEEDVSSEGDPGLEVSSSGLSSTSLYPNPSNRRFNLKVKLHKPSDLKVTVMDANGDAISQYNYDRVKESVIRIDLADIVSGVYLIQVRTDDDMVIRKVTIF